LTELRRCQNTLAEVKASGQIPSELLEGGSLARAEISGAEESVRKVSRASLHLPPDHD
jgi:hypothetical protein